MIPFDRNAYSYFCKMFKAEPSHIYEYKDASNTPVSYIVRFDLTRDDGTRYKETRPFILNKDPFGKYHWISKGLEKAIPLYNLKDVLKNNTVLVVEGEKTVEAAKNLFKNFAITTSMFGSNAPHKSDWIVLKGKTVIVCPDFDDPGRKYADAVTQLAYKASCESVYLLNIEKIVKDLLLKTLDPIKDKGYDLADAIDDGLTIDSFKNFDNFLVSCANFYKKTDESKEDLLNKLAALSSIDYQIERKNSAKKLGVQVSALDQEIKNLKKEDSDIFEEIIPWHEAVNLNDLLNEIISLLNKLCVLQEHADTVIALWIVFTYMIDSLNTSPILAIYSPEKQCGKTTLVSILSKLCYRPMIASNISPSALYRSIDLWRPTFLIDEADTFIDSSDELRGIINSGHTKSTAFVIRTVGENYTPKKFTTWNAKVIALIGKLPETLHDRSIVIELRRKLPSEIIKKLRDIDDLEFEILKSKIMRFANDNMEVIKTLRPVAQSDISDRASDNFEPLLAIALIADSFIHDSPLNDKPWTQRVYEAASCISNKNNAMLSKSNQLLSDIKEIFESNNLLKISTVDLINYLCNDDEKDWSTYNFKAQDKKITPKQLSNLLLPYKIKSKNISIDNYQKKGFERHQFEDAFNRYLNNDTNEDERFG